MPRKRELLQLFTRDELAAIVDRFELSASDRRSKDALVDIVSSSKKATLVDILPELSRDRLKEMCRAFDLDDSGREKNALVERLTDSKPRESSPPSKKNGSNGASAKTLERVDLAPSDKLTVDRLEGYLWSAADILRGSIDSSDYKNYIFGLLFLKRLSDRFEEECEALVKEGDDPEDKDNHQFFVPQRARWIAIQKVATDLGGTLNKACSQLEEANHSLEGVLAGIDYNDERKLGDGRNRDLVLGRLIQHFSKLSLKNADLSEPDMLGRAYEFLIEKFADDAGKKGGEFYTPRMVVRLIVEMLAPREGMRICDPTAGSGGMLIECAHYLERHKQNPRNLSLFGQERNLGTWAICKMNMLLHGMPDARIEKGDTLRDPKLRDGGSLGLFDRVIANPPFSQKDWGHEIALADPYNRFPFGIPPKKKQGSDMAFLCHMVATLAPNGSMGVILPHGALFRGGTESEIRQGIIRADLLEAVIGLPPSLFYGTPIPAAVLLLNKNKPNNRKRRVLFIDASRCFEKGINQDRLRAQDLDAILRAFASFRDVPEFARIVSHEQIIEAGNEWRIETFIGPNAVVADLSTLGLASVTTIREEWMKGDARLQAQLRILEEGTYAEAEETLRTDLGPCPITWRTWRFHEVADQVRDPVSVEGTASYREIGVRSHGKGIFHKEAVTGTELGDKKVFWVAPGCLIFNVVFAWEGAVATTSAAEEGMIASHRFPMFRPRVELADLEFLRLLFQSRPGIAALGRFSPGGAGRNKTLNQGSLKSMTIGLPALEIQRTITAAVRSVEESLSLTERLSEQLRRTRKSALELLGTGRLLIATTGV